MCKDVNMKQVKDLKIGDKIYYGFYKEPKEAVVKEIRLDGYEKIHIRTYKENELPTDFHNVSIDATILFDGTGTDKKRFYLNYSDYLANKKKSLLATLRKKKNIIEKEINELYKFRNEHYDELNEYCTDSYINKLKREGL